MGDVFFFKPPDAHPTPEVKNSFQPLKTGVGACGGQVFPLWGVSPPIFSGSKWLLLTFREGTLRQTNIAMENGPFEDVFPIENGDIPASYVSLREGK